MTEQWKPIPGYEGYYEVSDSGRVRSVDRVHPYKNTSRRVRGQIIADAKQKNGYRMVVLWRDGRPKGHLVHRLVLTAFDRNPEPGEEACHENNQRDDNRVENLRWGTSTDNKIDQVRHGTHKNSRKTHCPRGHKLEVPNLKKSALVRANQRECLSCARARDQIRHGGLSKSSLKPISDRIYQSLVKEII